METETYVQPLRAGRVGTMDIVPEYAHRITSDCKLARPMKVVVDSGNGIPGATSPAILRALGCEVIDIYSRVDGDFPNHHPDPSKLENLADLIKIVHATDAELGLAFDGDGDRLGVVTRQGEVIFPDRQMLLFARDILARQPGATIIYDVKCSQRLSAGIRDAGGVPMMWKTGHSLVKAKLRETGAPIAGEMSGHIFFGERWYGFDDAMYTAGRLLEILSRSADPSAVLSALPTSFATPELNVAVPGGNQHEIVDQLLARVNFPGAEIGTIDGLRADYPDGFGLIRASNTTPVLVLRFEGHTEAALHRIQGDFMAALREVMPGAEVQQAAH
jgi:phosphomannomutase